MSNEAEQHEGGKPSAMSTKKIIMIVSLAVIVSTSAIAGVLVYLLGGHRGPATAEAHTKGKTHAQKEAPVVYAMDPFIVNIHDGQYIRYLKLKVELETVPGEEVKTELDAYLPPMRDAILTLLSTKSLKDIQDLQGKNLLKEQILAALTRIVPPGKVSRVYFTDFMIQ